jgi:hypothetical protein
LEKWANNNSKKDTPPEHALILTIERIDLLISLRVAKVYAEEAAKNIHRLYQAILNKVWLLSHT